MKISAYIPCFNNAATVGATIDSIRAQTVPVDEFFVVDDGSADNSREVAESKNVRLVHLEKNLGRGAARARAMSEARHDLVLCCDATNILPPDFLEKAMPVFDDANVAAIFGRITGDRESTAAERWRGRHLFKNDAPPEPSRRALLITYGTVVRRSFCEAAGGYNPSLRQGEDADLGQRLLAAGHDVVFDPALAVRSIADNSLLDVLERYWRWQPGRDGVFSPQEYFRQLVYSIKVMAAADLRRLDFGCAFISLLCPHYRILQRLADWRHSRS